LKYHQKLRFYFFSQKRFLYVEGAPKYGFTIWIFNTTIFCMPFLLYVNFSIPPCGIYFFSQCSTPLVDMRFCRHIPNSPKDKNKCCTIHAYLKKLFFGPSKLCCPLKIVLSPFGTREKIFFVNFNP
jgi:hypothetical protein